MTFTFFFLGSHIGYSQTFEQNADAYLKDLVNKGKFSGTVLVAQNGNVVFCKSYGYANKERNKINTPQIEFNIGSITKPFVAVLIMQLVEKHQITLDEPMSDFFPGIDSDKSKITLNQLLHQTSGIADYTEADLACPAFLHHPINPLKFVNCINEVKSEFTPGSKFSYSNTNYYLLGLILEKVTGQTFEQVLRENILIPLKMTHTGYKNFSENILAAQGYTMKENKLVPTAIDDIGIAYSAGGMFSTVHDLYLFDQALRTEALLKKSTLEQMFAENKSVNPSYYGLGWYVDPNGDYRTFHEGGIDGFSSCIDRFLKNDLCIIALSNFEFVECRVDITEPLTKLFTGRY